jgi:hypothetical protein
MAIKKTVKKEDEYKKLIEKLKPAKVRWLMLYMGLEDGKCFNNATLSYIRAYNIDTVLKKVKDEETGIEDYTSEYKTAKSRGYEHVTNRDILKLKHIILLEQGYDKEFIKKRYAEIAMQNHNIPLALSATDRLAKITGIVTDDKKVDIPQLTELADSLKAILTPKK